MQDTVERAATGWRDAMTRLVEATPKGWYAEQGDAVALVTGCLVRSLNTAASVAVRPDLASLDAMAIEIARFAVPWSLIVRAEAGEAGAELAARHGLTGRRDVVMMACAAQDTLLRADEKQARSIRRAGSAESDAYTAALAEGFEIPASMLGSLMGGGVLDTPGLPGYLTEASGRPVATGLGIQTSGVVGVYNIAVVPRLRGQGLGRAMTARVLADAFADGADTAYLQTSEAGRPLYESMGFRQIEVWSMFT